MYLRLSHEVVTVTFFDGAALPHRLALHCCCSTMLLPSTDGSVTLADIPAAVSNDKLRKRIFFIPFDLFVFVL